MAESRCPFLGFFVGKYGRSEANTFLKVQDQILYRLDLEALQPSKISIKTSKISYQKVLLCLPMNLAWIMINLLASLMVLSHLVGLLVDFSSMFLAFSRLVALLLSLFGLR